MKKLVNLKQYRLSVLIMIITSLIGLSLVFNLFLKKVNINTFKNNTYSISYDNKWKIVNKKESSIELKNSAKANLSIEIVTLEDEYKYASLNDIIDNISYDINAQNKDYNLISRIDAKVTKLAYDGYKFLYENDASQAMITLAKVGDKIIIFNYEAKHKYFDILLDSVNNIIYNFNLLPDNFTLDYKISLDTNAISYSKNTELASKIKELKTYELANENYYVNYSLPDILTLTEFNSKMGSFVYSEGNNKINVNTAIFHFNIYDYLDSTKEYGNIYSDYSYLLKETDKYNNFLDCLSEFNVGDYKGYIYKVSYTSTEFGENDIEAYNLAIELNKNHILQIKIEGRNIKIPKELLDSIKINSLKNYSSYIKQNIIDDNKISELKRFSDYNSNEYESLKLTLPDNYRELDKKGNIYSNRYFGLNYDSQNEVYEYNIEYIFTPKYSHKASQVDLANTNMNTYKNYGEIKELSLISEKNLNGHNFSVYNGFYHKKDKLYNSSNESVLYKVNRKVLIHELEKGGCLVVIIDGNNREIDDNILSEISNFAINNEIYN